MHLPVAVHRHPRPRGALRDGVLLEHLSRIPTASPARSPRPGQTIHNRTRGTLLATSCALADSFLSRGIGLLGRGGLAAGEALRITRTSSITMLFMRFAIDALFVDRHGRVVKAAPRLRPWTPIVLARGAVEVIELPAGTIERTGTQAGDEIAFG